MNTNKLHMISDKELTEQLLQMVEHVKRIENQISELQDILDQKMEIRDRIEWELISRGVEVDW